MKRQQTHNFSKRRTEIKDSDPQGSPCLAIWRHACSPDPPRHERDALTMGELNDAAGGPRSRRAARRGGGWWTPWTQVPRDGRHEARRRTVETRGGPGRGVQRRDGTVETNGALQRELGASTPRRARVVVERSL